MSPTLIFDSDGKFYAAVGSPGGSRIIGFVVQSIIAMLDWGVGAHDSVRHPRFINRNGKTELEMGTPLEKLKPELEARGHNVEVRALTSGLHVIRRVEGWLEGGADPRREGVVRGN